MSLLTAVGIVFGLAFALNTLLQVMRRAPRIGFVHVLLAFLTALLPLVALVAGALNAEDTSGTTAAARALAALLGVAGLLAVLLEVRRPERLKASRGLLSLGVAALLALVTLTVPATATALLVTPTPFQLPTVTPTAPVTATLMPSPSPSATGTPTATRTPFPTETATSPVFATRTPSPVPTLPAPCGAVVNFNLNLRAAPSTEADVLASIPFNTRLELFGRSADSGWWYTVYEEQAGWVLGEFLTLDTVCAALPVREGEPRR